MAQLPCSSLSLLLVIVEAVLSNASLKFYVWCVQLNIAYPQTGKQKKLEVDEDSKL